MSLPNIAGISYMYDAEEHTIEAAIKYLPAVNALVVSYTYGYAS